MRSKLIIVDDFYAKPDRIRQHALASEYADISQSNYPGWASRQNLRTDTLRKAFSELVGSDIYVDAQRFTWGGFRFISEDTGRRTKVHADTEVDWAAMVYLTPDAPMRTGTGFFRHRKTGLDAPPTPREARALGYSDVAEFTDQVIEPDMADLTKWEEIGHVGPVFNRLVLFRGCEFFHAPLSGCGSTAEDARLTHIFFFNEIPHTGGESVPVDQHPDQHAGHHADER